MSDNVRVMKCDVPSEGWFCTREKGHEGPCAAIPLASATGGPGFSRLDVLRAWAEHGLALIHAGDDVETQTRATCAAEVLAILDGHE